MKKFFTTCLALALVGTLGMPVQASSISELEEKKKETESKKAAAQAIIDSLKTQQGDILAAIAALDAQVSEYNIQISELETQREVLETSIQDTKSKLADAQANEEFQYEAMKKRIQYSYENGDLEYVDTLFTSADMSEIVNRSEYAEQIYNYDEQQFADLVEIKQTIANTKLKLETDLESVQDIEEELTEDKEAVEILIVGKEAQAKSYADSIDEYQAQVALLQADIDATNELIAEAERKAEEERKKKEEEEGGGEIGGGVIYYTGGTFQWPVSSGGYVSSPYGPRWGRMHQGIDIACATGTPILAGESGSIIAAGYSSSMGNYVVIDHGGGVTTVYMHNSVLSVSVGQVVGRGQTIALAGSTGNSTGPHCHFGVRINGSYVDPAPYLY